MNDRETDHLRHGTEQTLKRPKDRESRVVRRECGAEDHKHGQHLRPQPHWQAGMTINYMLFNSRRRVYLPTVGFDEGNNKDTTEALQQNAIVHTRCRMCDGDVPIHGLLGD